VRRTRLSVNLNKIATLRNARGGDRPSVRRAAEIVLAAGADGITVHPRPDERHIRRRDAVELAGWLPVLSAVKSDVSSSKAGSDPTEPWFV